MSLFHMNLEWIWNGYLLATNHQGHIMDKRFSSSARPESRLTELYLRDARIDNGETLQSFWLGFTLTAFSNSSLADIMANVGWSNPNTASYSYPCVQPTHRRWGLASFEIGPLAPVKNGCVARCFVLAMEFD